MGDKGDAKSDGGQGGIAAPCNAWRPLLKLAGAPMKGVGARIEVALPVCEKWCHLPQQRHQTESELAAIVTASPDAILSFSPEGAILSWNPRAEELFGFSAAEAAGRLTSALIVPPSCQREHEAFLTELRAGRSIAKDTVRRHKDGTLLDVEIRATPICSASCEIRSVAAIYRDIGERKRHERRQLMLMNELSHRSKNLFSVINSVARLSLASAASIAIGREGLLGRLDALQRTYGRLTDVGFEGERLTTMLASELEAFAGRVQAEGPDVMLKAKAVQTLALIVHELATNAAKYGALSVEGGSVALAWDVIEKDDEKRFRFDWIERGGPPATPPERKGFGTTLITKIAAFDLDCKPELAYGASGFRYSFETPLSHVGTLVEASPVRCKLKNPTLIKLYDQWVAQLGMNGELPPYCAFSRSAFEETGALTIASVGQDFAISFLEVGRALLDHMGRPLNDDDMTSEDPNSLAETYRRCAKSARPFYEHVAFDFGDGEGIAFERLLVPYSDAGLGVTHIAGIAVFTGTP